MLCTNFADTPSDFEILFKCSLNRYSMICKKICDFVHCTVCNNAWCGSLLRQDLFKVQCIHGFRQICSKTTAKSIDYLQILRQVYLLIYYRLLPLIKKLAEKRHILRQCSVTNVHYMKYLHCYLWSYQAEIHIVLWWVFQNGFWNQHHCNTW